MISFTTEYKGFIKSKFLIGHVMKVLQFAVNGGLIQGKN